MAGVQKLTCNTMAKKMKANSIQRQICSAMLLHYTTERLEIVSVAHYPVFKQRSSKIVSTVGTCLSIFDFELTAQTGFESHQMIS